MPPRMSLCGWKALPDIQEWSGGPPGCLCVVGRPYRISRSGQEAPPGCLCVVGRPYRMSRSGREAPRMSVCGWEALPDVQGWSGGPPEYPGEPPDVCVCLGGFPGCPGVVGRQFRISGSGWAASGCPCVVGSTSQISGSCREALPDVRQWSGTPPGYPGVVGRPPKCQGVVGGPPRCSGVVGGSSGCLGVVERSSHISGIGRETLPNVRERSGGPPGCPCVVGRLSQMSWSGREHLPDIRE